MRAQVRERKKTNKSVKRTPRPPLMACIFFPGEAEGRNEGVREGKREKEERGRRGRVRKRQTKRKFSACPMGSDYCFYAPFETTKAQVTKLHSPTREIAGFKKGSKRSKRRRSLALQDCFQHLKESETNQPRGSMEFIRCHSFHERAFTGRFPQLGWHRAGLLHRLVVTRES